MLESKGKAVLTLAKPPRKSTFDEVTEWPALHFNSGATQDRGSAPATRPVTTDSGKACCLGFSKHERIDPFNQSLAPALCPKFA